MVLSVTVYRLSKVGSLLRFTPGGNSCICVNTTSLWPGAVSSPSFGPALYIVTLMFYNDGSNYSVEKMAGFSYYLRIRIVGVAGITAQM